MMLDNNNIGNGMRRIETEMNANESLIKRHSYLRFSITTLIVLMTCICCYLAGRANGHKNGRAVWNSLPLTAEVYQQGYLFDSKTSSTAKVQTLDDLVSRIKQDVMPSAWLEAGGNCTIMAFPENNTLVITANQWIHERLAAYLKNTRKANTKHAKLIAQHSIADFSESP